MKRPWSLFLAAAITIGVVAAAGVIVKNKQISSISGSGTQPLPIRSYGNELNVRAERERTADFIGKRLTGPYGIYTNYSETGQSAEAATGHEVLSESASLMMRYAAITKKQSLFDRQWELARQTFDMKSGFSYRYSPTLPKKYAVNAAVDDLRLIRALYEAGGAFADDRYTKEAIRYGSRFYSYNVKNGRVYDFYDETSRTVNDFITLCYIDLKTLGVLPVTDKQRQSLLDAMLGIAQNGYLGDRFPLYETRYRYVAGRYESETIQTVESLLTILHLAEVEQARPESIRYIKEQVKEGKLFGQYTKSGVPASSVQSTAIYALAAMLGSEIGDKELYADSIKRMGAFQITAPDHELFGGFGNAETYQAYSFDNLMALLAYSY
ncbi:hypothetical protein [Paenibacillus ginsengarvi]|uniref:Glycosyl hydrolase family 8 n=1 Tax=Paenibacillus ginsengarvi TaxID=400777 RepID=A0A3B0CL45_9BACL|nr:hypothetical protein [Paenibacillus ginsengarvi]RKN85680.1 hypothetical protein D7M11_08365 [Paenibacillus ginsengarvi]